jgi:chromate transporter
MGLLRLWAPVGLQSFGGGQAVQLYAYQALVESRHWMTPRDWARDWGLCQLSPGINLMALAALVGYRLAGLPGSAASLAGLLIPSVAITIVIAALYVQTRAVAHVEAAVHGMLMAAAGGSLLMAVRLMRPMILESRAEGRLALVAAVSVVIVCAALVLTGRAPVYGLVIGSGAAMALVFVRAGRKHAGAPR